MSRSRRAAALLAGLALGIVHAAPADAAYARPTNVRFTASTETSVTIQWTFGGATRGLREFDIRLTDDTGNVVLASASPGIGTRRLTVGGLDCGEHLDGRVRADYGSSGQSAWSASTDVYPAITGTAPCQRATTEVPVPEFDLAEALAAAREQLGGES